MLDLARRGAEARYRELVAELKMLAQAFPHLRDSFDGDELPVNFILRVGRDKATSTPARRTMSAKGRAAIAAAQKARWKRQKAAEKNK
jgi:hypothetical protein